MISQNPFSLPKKSIIKTAVNPPPEKLIKKKFGIHKHSEKELNEKSYITNNFYANDSNA